MDFTLKYIAELVNGRAEGDEDIKISGISTIERALEGDIVFASNSNNFEKAVLSKAAAVFCLENYSKESLKPVIIVSNPRIAFAKTINLFYKENITYSGVHSTVVKGENVTIDEGVTIFPNVFIGDNVHISSGTVIYPGVYVGNNVEIGSDCRFSPNAVIMDKVTIGKRVIIHSGAVLGSDGFGFERDGGSYYKIPQVGSIIIEDDVEIGANTCVDRATLGETRIGRGTKLDNLIQIAHNVSLGKNIVMAALSGISGSAVIEDDCLLAGNIGVGESRHVGRGSVLAARAGVIKDLPPGSKVTGYPPVPVKEYFRRISNTGKIPNIISELKEIKRELKKLKE